MSFHPAILSALKFQDERAICPFCQEPLEIASEEEMACECPTMLIIMKDEASYLLNIKNDFDVMIDVNLEEDKIKVIFLDADLAAFQIPHTKLPFFDPLFMRDKIKKLLIFI